MEDRRDEPQRVERGEDDRPGPDRRVPPAVGEHAGEDRELAGEVRGPGHGEREHAERHDEGRHDRAPLCHPTEVGEAPRPGARLDHRGEQEEPGGDKAVADRVQHRPVETEVGDGEDAEHDEAHLAHRRVRDDAADVGLAEREHGAVDERRGGEDEHDLAKVLDGLREVRQHDPDEPEDRGLRDDAREDRRQLGRRLGVGGAQPAVEREQRRLHRERGEEAEEHPVVVARSDLGQEERPLRDPERDDRREHQQRAGHRVEDEGHRRLDPRRAAPDADQHVDRDQHRLEEDVEEDRGPGTRTRRRASRQEQHQAVVRPRPFAADPEPVADRGGADDDRQPDEPVLEPVQADRVGDAELGEPLALGGELLRVAREVEVPRRADPEADLGEDCHEREPAGRLPRKGQHPHDQGGGERHDDEQRRQHLSGPRGRRGPGRHGDRDHEGVRAEQPGLGA